MLLGPKEPPPSPECTKDQWPYAYGLYMKTTKSFCREKLLERLSANPLAQVEGVDADVVVAAVEEEGFPLGSRLLKAQSGE